MRPREVPDFQSVPPNLAALGYINKTAAFLTAFNPYSELVTATQNETAHKHLTEDLSKKSVMVLEGVGQDSKKEWPPEKKCFSFGINDE